MCSVLFLFYNSGLSNNAAVLTRNRFYMADIGDESIACEIDSSGGGGGKIIQL